MAFGGSSNREIRTTHPVGTHQRAQVRGVVVAAQEAREALPGDVQRSLRVAFAAEVAARLPHLREPADRELVRHDVHTLASSAWVVGEQDISVLARAIEFELEDGREPSDLPALVTALEGFLP